nr:hypothetical protein [Candidatus Enterovibrio escacola]
MLNLMQGVLVSICLTSLTVRQGQQEFPSLIRPRYRFVTTYAFLDIRFLKVPRSEERNNEWL